MYQKCVTSNPRSTDAISWSSGSLPPSRIVLPGAMVDAPVYMAPNITVTPGPMPGTTYDDQAIYINGDRYYRDCWWDWGRRRCELKRWW